MEHSEKAIERRRKFEQHRKEERMIRRKRLILLLPNVITVTFLTCVCVWWHDYLLIPGTGSTAAVYFLIISAACLITSAIFLIAKRNFSETEEEILKGICYIPAGMTLVFVAIFVLLLAQPS